MIVEEGGPRREIPVTAGWKNLSLHINIFYTADQFSLTAGSTS
jgi:hypothetical protein